MNFSLIKYGLNKIFNRPLNAVKAYDLWADFYDRNEANLVFLYENEILNSLLKGIKLTGKIVLDYGCGTGRLWQKLQAFNPAKIIGCDTSQKMLEKLKAKYPDSESFILNRNMKLPMSAGSVDLIVSTLVVAQIKNIKIIFDLWSRLLNEDGKIIITDLHPAVLEAGGKRTFKINGKVMEIKNYIHTLDELKYLCSLYEMKVIRIGEKYIKEDSLSFYEEKNAKNIYDKFYGLPLVYGLLIGKKNDLNQS